MYGIVKRGGRSARDKNQPYNEKIVTNSLQIHVFLIICVFLFLFFDLLLLLDVVLVCWVDCSCVRLYVFVFSVFFSCIFLENENLIQLQLATDWYCDIANNDMIRPISSLHSFEVNSFNLNNLFVTITYFSIRCARCLCVCVCLHATTVNFSTINRPQQSQIAVISFTVSRMLRFCVSFF